MRRLMGHSIDVSNKFNHFEAGGTVVILWASGTPMSQLGHG